MSKFYYVEILCSVSDYNNERHYFVEYGIAEETQDYFIYMASDQNYFEAYPNKKEFLLNIGKDYVQLRYLKSEVESE